MPFERNTLTVLVDREGRIAISHAGVVDPIDLRSRHQRAPRRIGEHDVIEEGDRISARFTYNGTFSKAFMGYQPNSTAVGGAYAHQRLSHGTKGKAHGRNAKASNRT
jgi:hypothetical protein